MNFVGGKFVSVAEIQGEENLKSETPASNSSELEEDMEVDSSGEIGVQGDEKVAKGEEGVNSGSENVNKMNGDLVLYFCISFRFKNSQKFVAIRTQNHIRARFEV